MHIEERFVKFDKKIIPTEVQVRDAMGKCDATCKRLGRYYYDESKYEDKRIVFGSYGKEIGVRPPRDVDVLFKMPKEKFDQFDKHGGNGQSALLQDMKKAFSTDFIINDKLNAWGKVLVVKTANGSHNVEVLPAWDDGDGFKIPNTENGGSWEKYNPIPEIDEVERLDLGAEGKLRKLIRFSKKWTETCSVRITSFELERLACKYVEENNIADSKLTDSVRAFFVHMQSEAAVDHRSAIATAVSRMDKAHQLADKGHYKKATRKWKEVFGNDFPLSSIEDLAKHYPAPNEEFIDREYPYSIDEDSCDSISLTAIVEQKGFRPAPLLKFVNSTLLKNKKITFEAKTTVSKPYTLFWKVRNFGQEASKKGDLRGEIVQDDGFDKRVETTRYAGDHYIECFVIKEDKCVARAGVYVPIGAR